MRIHVDYRLENGLDGLGVEGDEIPEAQRGVYDVEAGLYRPLHLLAVGDQPRVDLHHVHSLEPAGPVEHVTDGHPLPECQSPSNTEMDTKDMDL